MSSLNSLVALNSSSRVMLMVMHLEISEAGLLTAPSARTKTDEA